MRDAAALRAVRPHDLAAYLRNKGWNRTESKDTHSLWVMEQDGDEAEVLLPWQSDVPGYAARIADMLRTVSLVEERAIQSILNDIASTGVDTIRFRAAAAAGAGVGTIPLSYGIVLVQHVRALLTSAANAAVKPRPLHRGPRYELVSRYLESVKLGQTERGSFVLAIQSPVSAGGTISVNGLEEPDEPFSRKATTTLMRSLQALRNAAAQSSASGEVDVFLDSVERGVSANMCDAVEALQDGDRGLDVSMTWASVRQAPSEDVAPSHVVLEPSVRQYMAAASQALKNSEPPGTIEVSGIVVGLKRDDKSQPGEIVIAADEVDGRKRKVRATLTESDYSTAIQAHDGDIRVRCVGWLNREPGNRLRLERISDFALEPEE